MSESKEVMALAKISPLMGEDNYSDWSFDIQAYLLGLCLMSTLHETAVLHIPVIVPTGDSNQPTQVLIAGRVIQLRRVRMIKQG